MPNNDSNLRNSNKKFNWGGLIVTIIILTLVGFGIWWFFIKSDTKRNLSQFENYLVQASASSTDESYFKSISVTESTQEIHAIYHESDKKGDISFNFGATRDYINNMLTDKEVLTINGSTVKMNTVWKSASIEDINLSGNPIPQPSVVWDIIKWILLLGVPILLGWLIWRQLRRSVSGGGGGGIFGPNPGRNKAKIIKSIKQRFNDIAGNEEVKEEIVELVDYLKNPDAYNAAGARVPKGVLLSGPPGTGKTLIAKATAGEANVPFYFISGSDFVEMFVGVGASRVREMFTEARRNAPCILFIDELDAVGRSRGGGIGGGNDEREQTLNQLLVEMDGIQENSSILVIAATNRPDVLDPALLRPGRFDRSITVNLPDVKEREAILKVHATGKRMHSSISFANIAKRTPGYSGAQLENVINEAAILSVRERTKVIIPEQIDEAIDRVMAGPAKKSRVISKEELTTIAYHEAGHAVIGLKVKGGQKVQKVTIIPRGQAGGYNLMTPEKEQYNLSKWQILARITSFMGGRAAEQIMNGKDAISTGASNDIEQATLLARNMVTNWGMSKLGPVQLEKSAGPLFLGRDMQVSKTHSDQVAYEIDKEVRDIIINAEQKAIKVIKNELLLLKVIAETLLERETIVAEEIEYMAKYKKTPPKLEKEDTKVKAKSIDDLIKNAQSKRQKKVKSSTNNNDKTTKQSNKETKIKSTKEDNEPKTTKNTTEDDVATSANKNEKDDKK